MEEIALWLYAKGLTTGEIAAHFVAACGEAAPWPRPTVISTPQRHERLRVDFTQQRLPAPQLQLRN